MISTLSVCWEYALSLSYIFYATFKTSFCDLCSLLDYQAEPDYPELPCCRGLHHYAAH